MYERFKYLLARDTDLKVQRFIKREPTLSSYLKEIDILKKLANEATSAFVSLPMGLFLVHCSEINEVILYSSHRVLKTKQISVEVFSMQPNPRQWAESLFTRE